MLLCVCSISHGQPPGERSVAITSVNGRTSITETFSLYSGTKTLVRWSIFSWRSSSYKGTVRHSSSGKPKLRKNHTGVSSSSTSIKASLTSDATNLLYTCVIISGYFPASASASKSLLSIILKPAIGSMPSSTYAKSKKLMEGRIFNAIFSAAARSLKSTTVRSATSGLPGTA